MNTILTELICPHCGEIVAIQRNKYRAKSIGHIKDMYCPYCKEYRKFIEIRDKDECYYTLLYKEELTDVEKLVFELLEKRREKNNTYGKK